MDANTRKRKQNIFSLSDEQIEQLLSPSSRTRVSTRIHKQPGVRQDPNLLHGQTNLPFNRNRARTSQLVESMQRNTGELINGTNEEENGNDTREEQEKKTRGPTHMLQIWGRSSTLPRIKLDFDYLGRPIGAYRSKFCEFLGTIARNGTYCPIDVEDWHKMPTENKKKMLHIVKSRYDIVLGNEGWILESINKKWRNWKSTLKTRYFLPDKNIEDLMDDKDERVREDQWTNILAYWNKEEVKVRSEKNKDARSKRSMNHLTGKRSFAQVSDKLAKEKGRPPSRAELFDACYTSANNTPPIVSKYLDEIKELRKELSNEDLEDPVGPNDLYAQVCGQDRPGRVRMLGEGISPSDVWGEIPTRRSCKRIMLEQQSELSKMKDEIAELQSQLFTQQRSISQGSQSLSLPNNFPKPTSTKQPLQVGDHVVLRSLFDPTKLVAKGFIHRIGSNEEVGRQILGENWCQIQVQVVLQSEEQLIRPLDFHATLGEALGEMIDWPCNLVAICERR